MFTDILFKTFVWIDFIILFSMPQKQPHFLDGYFIFVMKSHHIFHFWIWSIVR